MQEIRMYIDSAMDVKNMAELLGKMEGSKPRVVIIGNYANDIKMLEYLITKIPEHQSLIIVDTTEGKRDLDMLIKHNLNMIPEPRPFPINEPIPFERIDIPDIPYQPFIREPKPHQIKHHEFKRTKPRKS